MNRKALEFEKPLMELYEKIDQLKALSVEGNVDISEELQRIEKRAEKMQKEIFSSLTPVQILQVARHPNRPDSLSMMRLVLDRFVPLQGDRQFRDDPSIVGGMGILRQRPVMVIGHQKGHDTKENIYRNFGMPYPEGYRKALRLMLMAEKFNMPIVTFIDTPGAFPGIEAEERGQSEAIARNLREMANLSVPVVTFVMGEGGSGGALAIGVSNRVYMMEYSIYSVISPEGCASILFRDSKKFGQAAESLKILAKDCLDLGIIDGIIKEPLGGAHHSWKKTSVKLRKRINQDFDELLALDAHELKQQRYDKFRSMGVFTGA